MYAEWLKSALQIALWLCPTSSEPLRRLFLCGMTLRYSQAQHKKLMIDRIRSLERMHTKEQIQRRKLESVVEQQQRTIKKLRAQIRKKATKAMKIIMKKPGMKWSRRRRRSMHLSEGYTALLRQLWFGSFASPDVKKQMHAPKVTRYMHTCLLVRT